MKKLTLQLLSRLFLLIAAAGLVSCGSADSDGNAFLGQPSSQLLSSLGTPSLRAPDGQGGEIWTYIKQTDGFGISAGGMRGSSGYGAVGGPSSGTGGSSNSLGYSSCREFLIDSSGNVYKYRSRGL